MIKYVKMLMVTLVCMFVVVLSSCGKKYTITFNSLGGSSVSSQEVKKGDKATKPADPVKEGYIFIDWFEGDVAYNFSSEVTKDITLVAKWEEAGTYYTVSYSGVSIESKRVLAGTVVNQPSDPTKENSIFVGWYSDSNCTNKISFPITINADTVIYAKFASYQEAFEIARENTIGSGILGYEYDYTVVASASYSALSLTGNSTGNTKYNKNSSTSLYDVKTNSGVLFNDGSIYQLKSGNILTYVNVNEKNVVKKVETKQVSGDYKYDTSSFAKALFEYSNDQLKNIEKTSNANEYKLNTSFNASSAVSLVGNYLNHPMVEKIIGTLPETSVVTGMYVSFSGGNVKSYRYEMSINVTNLQFSLVYTLNFKNPGSLPTINPKTFEGLSISSSDINSTKNEILAVLNNYANQTKSGYDYKVVTGVDFGLNSGEINATIKGSTMRKVSSSNVYFHNDIVIDTDFKNNDLYKSAGLEDVHVKKSKLSNGDVYLIEKKVIDKTYLQENYQSNRADSYYLFDLLPLISSFSFIQKSVENGTTIYSMSGSENDLANILNWLNTELNVDPLDKASADVKVFGDFTFNSIKMDNFEVVIEVQNNNLVSVSLNAKGTFDTKYTGSTNFGNIANAAFDVKYELNTNNKADSYEPYSKVNEAK